jgi:hypothetical protein
VHESLSIAANPAAESGDTHMRALAYLIGARALDVTRDSDAERGRPQPEPDLGPIATTADTAAAWRRWRDAGTSARDAGTSARTIPEPAGRRLLPGTPG